RPPVRFVDRVVTLDGKVLYAYRAGGAPRVIRPEHVAMMNTMLSATVTQGTGRGAAFGWPAAGKTGTSQNARDAWFIGYTANLVTGVWFGNDDGRTMRNVTGGTLPVAAWKECMRGARQGLAVAPLRGGLWSPAAEVAGSPAAPAATMGESDPVRRPGPVPPAELGTSARGRVPGFLERLFGR